jgi:hypothetical protein
MFTCFTIWSSVIYLDLFWKQSFSYNCLIKFTDVKSHTLMQHQWKSTLVTEFLMTKSQVTESQLGIK